MRQSDTSDVALSNQLWPVRTCVLSGVFTQICCAVSLLSIFRCDHGICVFNSAADNEVTLRNSNKLSARTAGRTPLFMKHARLMDLYHVACDASRQGYGVGGSLAETVQGRAELVRRSGAGAGDGYLH